MTALAGKVAFITGAARGQGRALAVRMAQEGATILATDICAQVPTAPYPTASPGDLDETVELVEKAGGRILAQRCDVRDLAGMTQFAATGVDRFGSLDIVCANAGINSLGKLTELDEQTWQEMVDINLGGVWKTIRASVPHMIAAGRGGSVVITSSQAALSANEHVGHYTAAKSGLIGLMRVLAKEVAPHNIRVNTIHPTVVHTEMVHNESTYRTFRPDLESPGREDFEQAAATLSALPGVAAIDVEDVVNLVLYLVSDQGRYITGSTLSVDAGGLL